MYIYLISLCFFEISELILEKLVAYAHTLTLLKFVYSLSTNSCNMLSYLLCSDGVFL